MRGNSTGDFASAATCCCACGPATTPIGILSGAFARNANPNASASSKGNPNTQKIASVSRKNSLVRTTTSSTIGGRTLSDIAQLPSRQRHEEILERRRVRRERDQFRAMFFNRREKLRNGVGERVDAKLPRVAMFRATVTKRAKCFGGQFRLARELDDVARFEFGDEIGGRAEGDETSVIDNGNAIAETLRLFHVMRRQQHG